MKYTPPPGSTDPNAPYVTGIPGVIQGTPVPAEAVENPQREIVNAIKAAGLEPSSGELDQLSQAIQTIAWRPATYTSLGSVMVDKESLEVNDGGLLSVYPDGLRKILRLSQWLTANKDWYVNASTGSDSNDGETPATAFKTLQYAMTHVTDNFNISNYVGTINVAAGSYSGATVPKYQASLGYMRVVGAGIDQTIVSSTNTSAFYATENAGRWDFASMTVAVTNTSSSTVGRACFRTEQGARFDITNCKCILNENVASSGGLMCLNGNGGSINITGNGDRWNMNGLASGSVIFGMSGGNSTNIAFYGTSIAVSGIGSRFMNLGMLSTFSRGSSNPTFTGSFTGQTYNIAQNSICSTRGGGASYFPGNTAGAVSTGGQYF